MVEGSIQVTRVRGRGGPLARREGLTMGGTLVRDNNSYMLMSVVCVPGHPHFFHPCHTLLVLLALT